MISGRRRVVVGPPVGVVAVLVGIEVKVRALRVQTPRLADRSVRAFERTGQDQLGAKRAQNQFALGACVFGHAQFDGVAARRTDHRVGNARVPRRRVQNRLLVGQLSRRFAFQNHPCGRPILDRAARVLPFDLRVQLDARRDFALEFVQAYKRRPADQIEDGRTGRTTDRCRFRNR